ncbi:hypothetical protein TcasGA2_TC007677 [Tribolium castaneum]|uniref:Uncharacterized protein n=1 Tax=Tribolium castaneum TaxID=7070 RepID=D2A2B1_TRICA|nr:hypothetical protein TcasGA2_TC007677 [Tribolium castaneum]
MTAPRHRNRINKSISVLRDNTMVNKLDPKITSFRGKRRTMLTGIFFTRIIRDTQRMIIEERDLEYKIEFKQLPQTVHY